MKVQTVLQNLVFEGLSPSNTVMTDEEIQQWTESLPEIKKEIIAVMRYMVFSYYGNKLVHRHLKQIAKECTLMLDTMSRYPDFPDRMLHLQELVIASLKDILSYLWANYAQYLDPLVAMPVLLYRAAAEKIELRTVTLVQAMSRYHADKSLQAIVISRMTGLLQKDAASWQEIACLEKLQKWIMELCTGRDSNITWQLKHLLIRADFNTTGFVRYCQSWIKAELEEYYEVKEKYEILYIYERDYSTLTNKHRSKKFIPGQAKVKDQLLAFVRAELNCMLKKERSVAGKGKATDAATITTGSYRLPINISVESLAYLFKLLCKTKVVGDTSKDALLVFLAKNFQTPGVGEAEISTKSLDSKYRQVTNNTAVMVRGILMKMTKELDKEFID